MFFRDAFEEQLDAFNHQWCGEGKNRKILKKSRNSRQLCGILTLFETHQFSSINVTVLKGYGRGHN